MAQDDSIRDTEMVDILNDHLQINIAIDSIINTLSQPGVDKNFILNLKCTSLPYSDWKIPSINQNAIPKKLQHLYKTYPPNRKFIYESKYNFCKK